MNYQGPIIIVDDDEDDQAMYREVLSELGYANKVQVFSSSVEALEYIRQSDLLPFLIISDVRLPFMDGFELKEKLMETKRLEEGSIPFIFFTSAKSHEVVRDAYKHAAQGFFLKESTYTEFKETLAVIMAYWTKSFTPNKV